VRAVAAVAQVVWYQRVATAAANPAHLLVAARNERTAGAAALATAERFGSTDVLGGVDGHRPPPLIVPVGNNDEGACRSHRCVGAVRRCTTRAARRYSSYTGEGVPYDDVC
jgi:hypothetical protein